MFYLAGELIVPVRFPSIFSNRPVRLLMICTKNHELMVKRQPFKIDALCVLLLALFLVGLAGYSVVIRFLK
jgi:hypothetical protein